MIAKDATEIIAIRHGETEWNAQQRWQGHHDTHLGPTGRAQAEALGRRLAGWSFDVLYSSDLTRAVQTADAIARRSGHQLVTEPRLRERKLGIFEGHTTTEVQLKYPEEFKRLRSGDVDFPIPEGESVRQKHERTIDVFEDLAKRHVGQSIVVVTHGGILDSLFRHALQLPLTAPRHFMLHNASINTFVVTSGAWMLGQWGDISHLTDAKALDEL